MKKVIKCKDCARMFEFSDRQQAWFRENGWADPIRCSECIDKVKNRRKDPYFGWESTMGNHPPARRGHRRVHYAPHTVGGFR